MRGFGLRAVLGLGLAFALVGGAGAQPQTLAELPARAVVLAPGERVVLSAASVDPSVMSRGPAPAADLAAFPKLDNSAESIGATSGGPRIAPVPGGVVFELITNPKDGARLLALNGAEVPIIYDAVLVLPGRDRLRYVTTSICPVPAGRQGFESWPTDVKGIAVVGVHRLRPGETACNNGSLLSNSGAPQGPRYACSAQVTGDGFVPLFGVTLLVGADGSVSRQSAVWTISSKDVVHSPAVGLDFPMEGERLLAPNGVHVLAAVDVRTAGDAKSADIVLRVDGVEVARRPWRMFADRMKTPPPPGAGQAAFFGIVPIVPGADPAGDTALRRMLATIGGRSATLNVQVVADTGAVIADATYEADASAPFKDPQKVSALVQQAKAAARTPTQCRPVDAR